jgi:hypothetical protein
LLAKLALKERPVQRLWFLPIAATMGRPSKTLLEWVLAGSFRADRYGTLLDGELLPATSPFSDRRGRRLWQELRQAQRECQEAVDDKVFSAEWRRGVAAQSFSRIVRALHGGLLPSWLREDANAPRFHRAPLAQA